MKLSSALLAVLAAPGLSAAVIHSGVQNLPIPLSFEGIYLDIDGMSSSFTETAGWDINLTFGGSEIYNSDAFQPVRNGTAFTDRIMNLAPGASVDSGIPSYSAGFGFSDAHLGPGPTQFQTATSGYIGFAFMTNTVPGPITGPHYGWMYVTLTANVSGGVVHSWAYESTPGAALAVPEPSTYAALAGLAVLSLALRRRK